MTGRGGSVVAGQIDYGGKQEVEGFEPTALMASSQNKPNILVGEGQDFSHRSLAMNSPMMLNGPVNLKQRITGSPDSLPWTPNVD